MSRLRVGQLALALVVAVIGGEFLQAGGAGGTTTAKKKSWYSKTVTTTTITAPLAVDPDNEDVDSNATGVAVYQVVEVAVTFCGRTSTSICRTLTVSLSNLPTTDDNQVLFELNEDEAGIGTAPVVNNSATLKLTTKCGGTVPFIVEDDFLDVDATIGGETELDIISGTFGAPVVTVTTCGK